MKRQRESGTDDGSKRARSEYHQPRARSHINSRSGSGGGGGAEVRTLKTQREEDPHRLAQRQKQIDYGKNTLGYDRYCSMVPRHMRRKGEHPMTPDKTLNVSKKHFDSMIRRWRQALHDYDPPELVEQLRGTEAQGIQETDAVHAAMDSQPSLPHQSDAFFKDGSGFDPELADLDPSNQQEGSASIFDTFQDDEGIAVDYEEDDDDDLL